MTEQKALTLVKERIKPELIKVKDRKVSAYGFRHSLVFDHLEDHLLSPINQWCAIECLAKTMYGHNTKSNRLSIRKRIHGIFRNLLRDKQLLVIEREPFGQGHHGEAKAIKLYVPPAQENLFASAEQQYVVNQIERMRKRRELTEAQFKRACLLAGITDRS